MRDELPLGLHFNLSCSERESASYIQLLIFTPHVSEALWNQHVVEASVPQLLSAWRRDGDVGIIMTSHLTVDVTAQTFPTRPLKVKRVAANELS